MSSTEFPVSAISDPLCVRGKFFGAGAEMTLIKGVSFGPFPAGTFPDGGCDQAGKIGECLGANTIRVDEVPTMEFMHTCAGLGLRVFITLPLDHLHEFSTGEGEFEKAGESLATIVSQFRGHPALAGYFVGNEIETTVIRWMGISNLIEELEQLIEIGHEVDPGALFSYANSLATENLLPRNQDFVAFNLYPKSGEELATDLAHLQNLAGDKPLLISRLGVDSSVVGEEVQADLLAGFIECCGAAGVAGTVVFSWSDLRVSRGQTVGTRHFGMCRRDQSQKPVIEKIREIWKGKHRPGDFLRPSRACRMSVIVCTERGSEHLVPCLDSLTSLDYPDYEILLVNEDADLRVEEIAATYPMVQSIAGEGKGVGASRNRGAAAATGEILVYTGDDCVAGKDWLKWIVHLLSEEVGIGGVGGPIVASRPETSRQAIITAAPGAVVQVLLSDTRAEYLPGYNFAIRRTVWEELGGFNLSFVDAGGDVDFCWRAIEKGIALGFHPAAQVRRPQRYSFGSYLKDQVNHGCA